MSSDLYHLTASEISSKIKAGEISVEDYAKSLLSRIEARDEAVGAWAYLNPSYVLEQAKALDAIPPSERGTLHGIAIAVKDVLYTKGTFSHWINDALLAHGVLGELTTKQICPHNSTPPSTPTMHQK
jgi:Asp-tRNA(Asn)/Glu-tRNA(Gln) amidotransferase A subunit family amidase